MTIGALVSAGEDVGSCENREGQQKGRGGTSKHLELVGEFGFEFERVVWVVELRVVRLRISLEVWHPFIVLRAKAIPLWSYLFASNLSWIQRLMGIMNT